MPGVRVPRIFDPDGGLSIDQQIRQQVERVLRSDRHQDLLGRCPDSPQRQYLVADLLEQRRIVPGEAVLRPVERIASGQHVLAACAPFGGREQASVQLPVDERKLVLLPVRRLGDVALKRRPELHPGGPVHARAGGRLLRRVAGPPSDHSRVRVVALAPARDQIAVIRQLLVDVDDRVAGDTQLRGECAAGRQRAACREAPRADGRNQPGAKLCLECQRGGGLQTQKLPPENLSSSPPSAHAIHPMSSHAVSSACGGAGVPTGVAGAARTPATISCRALRSIREPESRYGRQV